MTVLLLVTLVSLVLAVVMSAIAWRVAREERARADARVAALSSDIQSAVAATGSRRADTVLRAVPPSRPDTADLFTGQSTTGASSRSVLVVGIGLFAFATLAALAVVLTGGSRATEPASPPTTARSAAPAAAAAVAADATSLELIALGQERDGDRLIVRGVVRNASRATAVSALTAVVFGFDADGGFVTSGRAAIDAPRLAPGTDSTFAITVPHASRVVRYRVSFRTDAAILPHVDRRHAG